MCWLWRCVDACVALCCVLRLWCGGVCGVCCWFGVLCSVLRVLVCGLWVVVHGVAFDVVLCGWC